MEKYNWEELVDSYVDEECSEEERRELESRAEQEPAIRQAIDDALWLREKMRSFGETSVPDGFDERLQRVLQGAFSQATVGGDADDAWLETVSKDSVDFVAASSSKNDERGFASKPASVLRAVRNPKFVGAVVATVAVVVVGAAVVSLQEPDAVSTNDKIAAESNNYKGDNAYKSDNVIAFNADPVIEASSEGQNWSRTPSPEGEAPKSESKQERQSQYWLKATLDDQKSITKKTREFQRFCDDLKLSYTKSNVDGEYGLNKVDLSTWTKIADWFENVGTCETSKALTSWSDGSSSETRNVRVLFLLKSSETAEPGEQTESNE